MTNAADVLFCKPRSSGLQMAIFATNEKRTFLDSQREAGTLFKLVRLAEIYITQNTHRRIEFGRSIERDEVPEIPFGAVREVLLNAFLHRDYERPENVQVDILADRVEVFNPGSLPEGMDIEAHLAGNDVFSQPRNKLIADVLYRSGDIEAYGSGLPRVKALCDEAGIGFDIKRVGQGTLAVLHRPDWEHAFGFTGMVREPDAKTGRKNRTQIRRQKAASRGPARTRSSATSGSSGRREGARSPRG